VSGSGFPDKNFKLNYYIDLEKLIMKKIATVISAASLAVVSASVSAWGWGDNGWGNNGWGDGFGDGAFDGDFGFSMGGHASGRGRGYGRGYGHNRYYDGYGYGPYGYGYAPYGYGVPVQPPVQLTEEQQQTIADQQAKAIENMQNAQKQAAEFYANQRVPVMNMAPMQDIHADRIEQQDARIKEMEARMEASRKEMDARMEESRKAFEQRRQELDAAYKARLQQRTAPVKVDTGV
jgi:hypothetical protein